MSLRKFYVETNSPVLQENTDPTNGSVSRPLLSIQGDISDFALCESGDLNVVVFQPTSDNFGTYDFGSCYSVDILIFENR